MIAPGISVVDVEPDGFGLVCELAGGHASQGRGELHVLHDQGRVLRVVHTRTGATKEHRSPLGPDLAESAAALRVAADVDRVILVDRDGLTAEAAALAAVGPSDVDQLTVFRRSNALFWSSPAVVTDPAAPSTTRSWDHLADHVRALGPDVRALVAGYDGERCAFTLVARLVDALVVHLTSLEPVLGDARPPRSRADELVVAAERGGRLDIVLVADLDVLRDVLRSADLPAALAACAPQALITRGLPA